MRSLTRLARLLSSPRRVDQFLRIYRVRRMKFRFRVNRDQKARMSKEDVDRERPVLDKNRCIIFAANAHMTVDSGNQWNNGWSAPSRNPSNLIIQVEENSFYLHKLPMVSRSQYLRKMVFQSSSRDITLNFQISNFPGGSKIFELVVKFCYRKEVELTSGNVDPLYCAAHFLEMSDDLEQGNLISKTEAFLSFLVFSSWKDTFRIFKSCESISSWARELQILKRCSESVAWKVSVEPNESLTFSFSPADKKHNSNTGKGTDIWWFKDLSYLRVDHFIEVIESIKRKGKKSEVVGSCISYWTTKWLSRNSLEFNNLSQKPTTIQLYRATIRSLINLLPEEEKSVSFNFLLHLLKMGLIVNIDIELLQKLERRLAFMLDSCRAADLLVKNHGFSDTIYDVGIVVQVVEAHARLLSADHLSRKQVIGRLVDEYLTLVARDENLSPKVFQLLVEMMPKDSRYCDDNLYRAIDMYLKAHPSLSEKESSDIC